jgi:AcrR family transcriptional regulator
MQPELRKQELIEIAFRQFLNQGYEKTSIRSIVGEANGEIGMFYHHFASKEDIFKAVLEQYNTEYISKIENLIKKEKEAPIFDLLEHIFLDLQSSLAEYTNMNNGMGNKQILMMLHQNTLISLKPIFCKLLQEYIDGGQILPPEIETDLLTDFLLFGISALIHDQGGKSIKEKEQAIKVILCRLLGAPNQIQSV